MRLAVNVQDEFSSYAPMPACALAENQLSMTNPSHPRYQSPLDPLKQTMQCLILKTQMRERWSPSPVKFWGCADLADTGKKDIEQLNAYE